MKYFITFIVLAAVIKANPPEGMIKLESLSVHPIMVKVYQSFGHKITFADLNIHQQRLIEDPDTFEEFKALLMHEHTDEENHILRTTNSFYELDQDQQMQYLNSPFLFEHEKERLATKDAISKIVSDIKGKSFGQLTTKQKKIFRDNINFFDKIQRDLVKDQRSNTLEELKSKPLEKLTEEDKNVIAHEDYINQKVTKAWKFSENLESDLNSYHLLYSRAIDLQTIIEARFAILKELESYGINEEQFTTWYAQRSGLKDSKEIKKLDRKNYKVLQHAYRSWKDLAEYHSYFLLKTDEFKSQEDLSKMMLDMTNDLKKRKVDIFTKYGLNKSKFELSPTQKGVLQQFLIVGLSTATIVEAILLTKK